jgi:hypothetical protein
MTNALKKHGFLNIEINYVPVSEVCASVIEIFMIWFYDLTDKNNGYNKTSGGKSGWIITEELRERLSAAKIGSNNPNFGKPRSVDTKVKIGYANSGENHWTYGKPLSDDHKTKLSAALSGEKHPQYGKPHSDEMKMRISKAQMGERNHNFGKPKCTETKIKMSRSLLGVSKSYEHRMAMSASKMGGKNIKARTVVVDGEIYGSTSEAIREAFPTRSYNYICIFIRKHPDSDRMFYISKEFYMYCKENGIENVTRTMYNGFEYYMNNLL